MIICTHKTISEKGVALKNGAYFTNDEVVLITGGASGLGRVLVEMFMSEGAKVAFTYLNSESRAKELESRFDGRAFAMHADASDYSLASEVVQEVVSRYGRLDAIVNNAAAARHDGFFHIDDEAMAFTFNNTFMPAFNYTQAAAKVFVEQGKGSIVQIGSINGERGREGSAPYCAMKAAIEGMSKTVAKELGRFNVRCNVVSPGYISTDGQEHTSPLIHKMVLEECAIPYLADPCDIGELILFLASDRARAVTGQVYRVDYGQYI